MRATRGGKIIDLRWNFGKNSDKERQSKNIPSITLERARTYPRVIWWNEIVFAKNWFVSSEMYTPGGCNNDLFFIPLGETTNHYSNQRQLSASVKSALQFHITEKSVRDRRGASTTGPENRGDSAAMRPAYFRDEPLLLLSPSWRTLRASSTMRGIFRWTFD